MIELNCQGFCNHCQYPTRHGKFFLLTLLKDFQLPNRTIASWWSLISSLSMDISSLFATLLLQRAWLRHSSPMCTGTMDCLTPSSLTETVSSQAIFGRCCSSWPMSSYAEAQPTIHNRTAKLSVSTNAWRRICAVLFMPHQPNGVSGSPLLSSGTT